MKTSSIVCAIAVASLGFSALSFAQGNDRRGARDEQPQWQRQDQRPTMRQSDHGDRPSAQRQDDLRDEFRGERRNDRAYYHNARGPEFSRGAHVPREFRNRQYVVTDYRAHRLSPPPRGHEWVQVGTDYVLIAIVTGVIANIILGH